MLTLPAGVYQLEVEMTGDGPASRARLEELVKQLGVSEAELAAGRQMYTEQHPKITQLETQLANLRSQLAYFDEQRKGLPKVSRVQFRVP